MSYLEIARESLNQLRAEEPGLDAGRVATMKLDEFGRAGLIVQVRSKVLDADVLFVSDNVPESKLEGRPEVIYRADELKRLARLPPDPEELRTVHMVKEIYGGTIQEVSSRTDEDCRGEVSDGTEG